VVIGNERNKGVVGGDREKEREDRRRQGEDARQGEELVMREVAQERPK
jgi:hypothetical protein